jgi:hypothetical protein
MRTLLAVLALALTLALAAPPRAEAAGLRNSTFGRTLLSFIPRWLTSMFERSAPPPPPPSIKGDGGYAIDPDG